MPKVKIYSTLTCPYCKMAKAFFKEKNIEFEDIDVTSDKKAAQEMKKISGQSGVPVIDINGKILIGFDAEKIEEALK
tara:strand:- start:435 stop:665 length:231 start_codon:yes stop_codon:yes gene_type:complete